MVLDDLKKEHPDAILIRLNGMLHSDDNCATKEIARQLCLEHQLSFPKMASSDDNTEFMIDMLRCTRDDQLGLSSLIKKRRSGSSNISIKAVGLGRGQRIRGIQWSYLLEFVSMHFVAHVRLEANRKLSPLEGIKLMKKVAHTLITAKDASLAK
uniref:Uncharacterized protein n=2 Tax=Oryza nivara TaxID=4536 RepID=A0A0E0J4E4_ORYNI